jgi:hypothetical protein
MIDPAGCTDKSLGGPYSIISVGDSKGIFLVSPDAKIYFVFLYFYLFLYFYI